MKYFEKIIQGNPDIAKQIPILRYKVKGEQIKVENKTIHIDDITHFYVKEENEKKEWIPAFMIENPGEMKLIDLTPFVIIGAVETFGHNLKKDGYYFNQFLSEIYKLKICDSIEEICHFETPYNQPWNSIYERMRRRMDPCGCTAIMELIRLLIILYINKKEIFTDIFTELLICGILYMNEFTMEKKNKLIIRSTDPEIAADEFFAYSNRNLLFKSIETYDKYGAVELLTPKETYLITDSGNLSCFLFINLVRKFYSYFYPNFIEDNNQLYLYDEEITDDLNNRILNCLGKDEISKYFRTGKISKYIDDNLSYYGGMWACDSKKTIKVKEKNVLLDCLIEEQFFRHNYNLDLLTQDNLNVIYAIDSNMHYHDDRTYLSILGNLITYACSYLEIEKNNKIIKAKLEANEKREKELLSTISQMKKHKQNNISEDMSSALKEKEEIIKKLEYQLQQKDNYCNSLLQERDEIQKKYNEIFAEEEIDFEKEEEKVPITLEEKITFLNDFTITLIGGRWEALQALKDMGMTNIYQINFADQKADIPRHTDFVVFCTKFLSHSLFSKIKDNEMVPAECQIYFNGTNKETLIDTCYCHILRWLNK